MTRKRRIIVAINALVLTLVLSPTFKSEAQQIENVLFKVSGSRVEVKYDLIADETQLYRIEVFSTHNNYSSPLVKVAGDVGDNIVPGKGKSIIWDAASEIGSFSGKIELEVRGFIMPPFLKFTNISNGKMLRRGKTTKITWQTDLNDPNINFELQQEGQKILEISRVPNNGTYNWSIPKNRKTGKNFRLVATSNGQNAQSAYFKIGNKVPLALKILPVAIVAGLVAVLVSGGNGNSGTTQGKIGDPTAPGN